MAVFELPENRTGFAPDVVTALIRHDNRPYRPVSAEVALALSVSVVIPVKNEAANLPHVFGTIPAWITEVVLVDGRSSDDTVQVARRLRPDVKVVTQTGRGKGDALLAGFAACTGDIIVAMDGDGSTHGNEIIQFVSALATGADFVKGSRFASGGGSADITRRRRYGNRALLALVNRIYGTRYSDLCYGFNAFWRRHLVALAVDCDGFEVEALMNIRAAKAGLRIHEVPSYEHQRLYGASNLRAVRDGLRVLRVILRERSVPAKVSATTRLLPRPVRLTAIQAGAFQAGAFETGAFETGAAAGQESA